MNEIENLEKILKKRYQCEAKIKEGFYLRVRENETKVYYNGVKAFELNNSGLTLNINMFLPNSKNIFTNGQKNEQFADIPKLLLEDAKKIEQYFKIKINETLTLPFSMKPKIDKGRVYREVKEDIEKNYSFLEIMPLEENAKSIKLKLKDYQNLTFESIYKIKYLLVDFNSKYLDSEGKSNFQSVKTTISCTLNEKIDVSFLDRVEEIMKRRIGIYTGTGKPLELNRTKLDSNQEKQVQQDLMVLLNNKNHDDIYLVDKEGNKEMLLFSKEAYPFEMEYTIFAGENTRFKEIEEDEEENSEDTSRARENIKGRIDNVFIDGNKLILGEIKYGSSVISGSNGIHKHLMDLYTCLKHNKKIKEEIIELVNDRNRDLFENSKKLEELQEIEYDILCFYDPKFDSLSPKGEPNYEEIKNEFLIVLEKNSKSLQKIQNFDNEYNKKVLKNMITKDSEPYRIKNVLKELSSYFKKGTEEILSHSGVLEELNNTFPLTGNDVDILKDNLLKRGKIIPYDAILEVVKKKDNESMHGNITELIEKACKMDLDLNDAKLLGYVKEEETILNAYSKKKCQEYFLGTLEEIRDLAEAKGKKELPLLSLFTELNVSGPNQYDLEIMNWNVEKLMKQLKEEFNCSVSVIIASREMKENKIVGEIYKSTEDNTIFKS